MTQIRFLLQMIYFALKLIFRVSAPRNYFFVHSIIDTEFITITGLLQPMYCQTKKKQRLTRKYQHSFVSCPVPLTCPNRFQFSPFSYRFNLRFSNIRPMSQIFTHSPSYVQTLDRPNQMATPSLVAISNNRQPQKNLGFKYH